MNPIVVGMRCKCCCDKNSHEWQNGSLICSYHNAFKCVEFEEDNKCYDINCGHYATSHDNFGRCHVYITDEEMCFCNDFREKNNDGVRFDGDEEGKISSVKKLKGKGEE